MSQAFRVVQLVPALESGGVERAVLEVAEALVAAGHRAVVVSAGGRLVADLERIGAEHIVLDIGRKSLFSLRHIFALRRIFADVDIVHARSRFPAWLAWLTLKTLRTKRPRLVTTVHGLNSVNAYSAVMMRGERVIAISQTVHDHILRHYPDLSAERIRLIPRGIDPARFPQRHRAAAGWRAAFEAAYPAAANKRWICMPGRGTRLKGHDDALRLLADLRAHGTAVALILLGAEQPHRSEYIDELRAMAQHLGIADDVVITPPRFDVCDVMSASALVLQLSRKPEAFGRTVVEALNIGVPVLGWAHGGAGELLRELFPEGAVALGDTIALAQVANELLTRAPIPKAFEHYRLQQMQEATLAVYHELLAEAAQ